MKLPAVRLRGPVAERDVTVLLSIAVALVVLRLPGGFVMLRVLPLLVILVMGLRLNTEVRARPLWALLLTALATSTLSVLLINNNLLTNLGNNAFIMVALVVLAIAVLFTGHVTTAANRLIDGLYRGLGFAWAVSIGEVLTGFKLLPRLYPNANTVAAVKANRLFVTAFFPNYNDYSVAMTILVTGVLARMLFAPHRHPLRRLLRHVVLVSAVGLVGYMGSRGALISMAAVAALMVVMVIRTHDRHAIGPRLIVNGGLLGVIGAAALWFSPYVQDHSTAQRGTIVRNAIAMMREEPLDGWLGYGSFLNYQQAAALKYGAGLLMDPHNLLLELVIWYGLPVLVLYLVCWFVVLKRGFIDLAHDRSWRVAMAVVVSLVMPLLGMVPSSILRYYVVWIALLACFGYFAAEQIRQRRVRQRALTRSASDVEPS